MSEQNKLSIDENKKYRMPIGYELRGRYVIQKVIGEGGFGITYKGYDKVLDTLVAIKEFYPAGLVHRNIVTQKDSNVYTYKGIDQDAYEKGLQDFLNEARTLADFGQLSGIVSIRDFFEENKTAYIIMEYIDGMSVKQYVREYGPIPYERVLKQMRRIFVDLEKLHRHGMVHRDLSSDNIMIMSDGELKLIDFGSARHLEQSDKTQTVTVMFKRGYAAEEQYRIKGKQGPWTDVYGICATMYFMMTGKAPEESVERVVQDNVKPLDQCLAQDIPGNISKVIETGMAVKAKDRIQSIKDLYYLLYQEIIPATVSADSIKDNRENDKETALESSSYGIQNNLEKNNSNTELTGSKFRPGITFTSMKNMFDQEIHNQQKEKNKKSINNVRYILLGIVVLCVLSVSIKLAYSFASSNDKQVSRKTTQTTNENVVKTTDEPVETETPMPSATPVASPKPTPPRVAGYQGKMYKKVKSKIRKQGIPQVELTYSYHNTKKKGVIIKQSPKKGTRITENTVLKITISKGKESTPKPRPTKKPTKKSTKKSTKKTNKSKKKSKGNGFDGNLDDVF